MPEQTSEAAPSTSTPADSARITLCITELDPGGAEKALVRFAVGLHQRGWNVDVVSLRNNGKLGQTLQQSGIHVTPLNCGGLADIRAMFRLARHLRRRQPDLLFCFLHQANLMGRLAARISTRCPVVSGIRVADRRWSIVWPDRLTQSLTCQYIAVSQAVATAHAELCRIPIEKLAVVYNGVDVPNTRPPRPVPPKDQLRLLFVGRLTAQKRPLDLLQAISQLSDDERQAIHLTIVGEGELRSTVEQQRTALQLSSQVELAGFQSNVARWMRQADLLVLPSAWEGLPNVVLEAMAQGLPVLATAVDGTPEAIVDGETGWLYPPGDVAALTEHFRRQLQSPAARNQVSERAFEAVRQHFCWDSSVSRLAEILLQHVPTASRVEKNR